MIQPSGSMTPHKNHIIIIGNEKGGAGKTTTAMHLIINLLELGLRVASIDVDSRQLSLTRYIENRQMTNEKLGSTLAMPMHFAVPSSTLDTITAREQQEGEAFIAALESARSLADIVVVDTPGSNSYMSRLAHSYADTIITPINDSFIDLDVLARVEADGFKIVRPAIYSQMVWEQKMKRASRDQGKIQWVVVRNRLSSIDAKNKRNMAEVLDNLAKRIGFRHVNGFSERVIFRELFLQGLTLLDTQKAGNTIGFNLSHVAARQELREFLKSLQISMVDFKLQSKGFEETAANDKIIVADDYSGSDNSKRVA